MPSLLIPVKSDTFRTNTDIITHHTTDSIWVFMVSNTSVVRYVIKRTNIFLG